MENKFQLLIVFGYPGSGKTFVGKILEKEFGYFHFDGDNDLTHEMRELIKTKKPFTDSMRDRFFQKLLNSIEAYYGVFLDF